MVVDSGLRAGAVVEILDKIRGLISTDHTVERRLFKLGMLYNDLLICSMLYGKEMYISFNIKNNIKWSYMNEQCIESVHDAIEYISAASGNMANRKKRYVYVGNSICLTRISILCGVVSGALPNVTWMQLRDAMPYSYVHRIMEEEIDEICLVFGGSITNMSDVMLSLHNIRGDVMSVSADLIFSIMTNYASSVGQLKDVEGIIQTCHISSTLCDNPKILYITAGAPCTLR